jgi:hypothetical protein
MWPYRARMAPRRSKESSSPLVGAQNAITPTERPTKAQLLLPPPKNRGGCTATPHQAETPTSDVFVARPVPIASDEPPPGQNQHVWSPISARLISGERNGSRRPLMTFEQGRALDDWVAATRKTLTTVYVTHGHGDHWFGHGIIPERSPNVRVVTRPCAAGSAGR